MKDTEATYLQGRSDGIKHEREAVLDLLRQLSDADMDVEVAIEAISSGKHHER